MAMPAVGPRNLAKADQTQEKMPTEVGAFRIEGILGKGGMGVVYRGVDPDGAVAAVKVVRAHGPEADDYLRRFELESKIRIEHPNVVQLLQAGTGPDGDPWIAFELLEGESLREHLRGGTTLDPPECVSIVIQACRGLAAAHGEGVVHRDLKPGNLFLCQDGMVKLLDFGVARWNETESDLTMGRIVGTPAYLAPEQARGEK